MIIISNLSIMMVVMMTIAIWICIDKNYISMKSKSKVLEYTKKHFISSGPGRSHLSLAQCRDAKYLGQMALWF